MMNLKKLINITFTMNYNINRKKKEEGKEKKANQIATMVIIKQIFHDRARWTLA